MLAMVLLTVRAETRYSTSLRFEAEMLQHELLWPFPHLAGGLVLGGAVALVEPHADVPIGWRRPRASGRLLNQRFSLLGWRDHRPFGGQLNEREDVLLQGE